MQAEAAQGQQAIDVLAYQDADSTTEDAECNGILDISNGTSTVEVISQGVSAVLAAAPKLTCAVCPTADCTCV
jgi:hypothetical protein